MTSEIDIMRSALKEYEKATKMKNMNQELLEHLRGMYLWLFRYSEKYDIPIPKKEEVLRMAERADLLIDEITLTDHKIIKNTSVENQSQNLENNRKFTDDDRNHGLYEACLRK